MLNKADDKLFIDLPDEVEVEEQGAQGADQSDSHQEEDFVDFEEADDGSSIEVEVPDDQILGPKKKRRRHSNCKWDDFSNRHKHRILEPIFNKLTELAQEKNVEVKELLNFMLSSPR